jgi:hypothetical protein
MIHHNLNDLTLQKHDVVVEQIIPFAYKLNDSKTLLILAIKHF